MGEKKGLVFGIVIFACFILPFALDVWIGSVKTDHFMKTATEFHQLVEQEGGETETVKEIKNLLESNGLHVTLKYSNGQTSGRADVGTTIVIRYQHSYKGIIGNITKNFDTSNKVIVSRRTL